MEYIGLFALFGGIAIAIVIRLIAGQMNHARIKEYIMIKGGHLISIAWEPFGPGWFGEKSDVIYRISYRDREGNVHTAFCKTSAMSDVYLSEDRITKRKSQPTQNSSVRVIPTEMPPDYPNMPAENHVDNMQLISIEEKNRQLEDENRALKEEVRRLKAERDWR